MAGNEDAFVMGGGEIIRQSVDAGLVDTYNTQGRGVEQVSDTFPLVDLLPYGRQEEWQDAPTGWPQSPTYSRWAPSEDYARYADLQ